MDELKLLYNVFKRDPSTFNLIIHKMNPYIHDEGEKIVNDENNLKDPILFTDKLLEFKADMDKLVSYSFEN